MLGSLENSERFKKEYRDFSDRISKLTDENLKKELSQKLTELLREVRYIDKQHEDIYVQKAIPATVPDSRSKLTELRRFIDKRLKDAASRVG